ncbi:unnamed protein product, partial [Brassicogethes aeneus]
MGNFFTINFKKKVFLSIINNFVHQCTRCVQKIKGIVKFRGFGESGCHKILFIMLVYMPPKYDKNFSCFH